MKKIFALLTLILFSVTAQAQYGTINAILQKLEERQGITKELTDVNIDNRKFMIIKDFEDHTERNFVIFKGKEVTYVELFDDKATGETTSNIFTGDFVRSRKNVISIRCNLLEGKKITIPVTKVFLLTKQRKILYLLDMNSKDRWIDESSF